MNFNKEVSVPIWVLVQKVEDDYEEYEQMAKHGVWEKNEKFPIYDTTIKCLEILKREGLTFKNGTFSDGND